MIRLMILAVLATTAATASTASTADAQSYRDAGSRGTATAYELDGRTVIDVKTCFRTTRHGGYDYVRCGSRLRDSVKLRVCRQRGAGTHGYLTQIGDNAPRRSTVYCSSRRY
jgi:hypothetical protein